MIKKTIFATLAAAAILCLAVPAAAETYTTSDGVLSIELPNESWKEMQDPLKWVALSDGANLITIEHYSNGETLPAMTIADDHYVNVYQAVVSTQNEVFIITGSVVDSVKIADVCNAIVSAKVLQYDTKLAIKKDAVNAGEFTVVPMDATMYATSGVNVRSGCSTNDQILGAVAQGESVHVTGKVQRNGADYGWYQVSFNSGTGYINASFLSDKAGEGSQSGKQFTGEAKTIYEIDGAAVTVYKAADGYWYDSQGTKYDWITEYEFSAENGAVLSVNRPQAYTGNTPSGDSFTVYWGNGNADSLTPYSDGYYYSDEWVRYSAGGDGAYYGADGTTLYAQAPSYGSNEETYHKILDQNTGAAVIISENPDGSMTDEAGNNYYFNDNGVYDDAENTYDVLW
ncbi:MAG: SH3 domain-containing protein [Blautia sp.]|nr:SH3 domain-containing protein [Blautia sp.]